MAQLKCHSLDPSLIFSPPIAEKKTIPLPVSLTFRTDLSSLMAGMYFILLCILSAQLRELSMGFCKTSLSTGTFTYVISFDLQMTNKEKKTVIIFMRRNQGSKSLINLVQSHIVITGASLKGTLNLSNFVLFIHSFIHSVSACWNFKGR